MGDDATLTPEQTEEMLKFLLAKAPTKNLESLQVALELIVTGLNKVEGGVCRSNIEILDIMGEEQGLTIAPSPIITELKTVMLEAYDEVLKL